ncbi:hypothetical protein LSH36_36g00024 [Paralvinella palmiformis]|uniref:Uncharacterized protein n=1 Tax=Paralvinella palmiformis TaxID=53620 RepID=A0AAD9K9R7_9ANNE|nr:hypothetical protein LSH36_36g00024 [Paralvinella palmiformis]
MDKKKKGRGRPGKQEDEKETLAFKVLSAEHTKILAEIEDIDELQQ